MVNLTSLEKKIASTAKNLILSSNIAVDELTLETTGGHLLELMMLLKSDKQLQFEQLIDLCVVDYHAYGISEWETAQATLDGFCRGREKQQPEEAIPFPGRFAVVYHLLSLNLNQRVRVKLYCEESDIVPSTSAIWPVANWLEREAYDLYGLFFDNHPDLRRILTDYGFVGHPFRKDFPVSGHVEMRYDAKLERVIYEPVSIEPRTLVPKVIRKEGHHSK